MKLIVKIFLLHFVLYIWYHINRQKSSIKALKTAFSIKTFPTNTGSLILHNIFITGADPKDLISELSFMGESIITIHTKEVPLLDEINSEQCYFYWDIVLTTQEDINAIEDVFMFVKVTT